MEDFQCDDENTEAEEDLEDDLEIPKHYLNEHELNLKFVSSSPDCFLLGG